MRIWLAALLLLVLATPSWSAQRRVTLYLDGAVVEEKLTTHRGHAEIELPAAMQPGSLRVRPSGGTVITEVNISQTVSRRNPSKELARLIERKERLADRLKGLDAREEIFRAAAKSQSGKAPRKTRNNPEPLASIRQGTNLALSQLEEVFRQQRVVRRELAETAARIDALDTRADAPGSVARIAIAGKGDGAVASYIRTDLSWTPRYDFRLDGTENANVTIRPLLPAMNTKAVVVVRLARLAEGVPERPGPAMQLPTESIRLPVEQVTYRGGPGSFLTFSFSGMGESLLPPGDAACYWQGEYLGTIPFAGCQSGATCKVAVGALPLPAPTASP